MFDIFGFLSGRKKQQGSKIAAKDRLKLVLVHDRANCSPQFLELLKNDIIQVISNYMEIDEKALEMNITQTHSEENNQDVPMLYANIPILAMKKQVEK